MAGAGTPAPPSLSCAFSPEARTLTIEMSRGSLLGGFASIGRAGDTVTVSPGVATIACAGGVPTVSSIDTILVNGDPDPLPANTAHDKVNIGLEQGALVPGVTDEGDGSSEIEILLNFSEEGSVQVLGTTGPDRFTAGTTPSGLGVNLNPDEAVADVDVRFTSAVRSSIYFRGLGGDDRMTAAGGPAFTGPATGSSPTDRFYAFFSALGGGGDDVITGSPENDDVRGGGGRDVVKAGAGGDFVRVADDHTPDRADCGPGADNVDADDDDRTKGCER